MVKIFFLILFFGAYSWNQPVGLPAVPSVPPVSPIPQTFVPNLQAPAVPLAKGTSIAPLCDPSLNVPCLQQWVHQARPMAVTAPGASLPTMRYFLPSLLIRNSLPTDTKMDDDWELFTPSFYGTRRSSSRKRTRYYKKKSDPSKVRRVTVSENEAGEEQVEEIVSADAINVDADRVVNTDSIGTTQKTDESDSEDQETAETKASEIAAKEAAEEAERAKTEETEAANATVKAAEEAKAAEKAAEEADAAAEAAKEVEAEAERKRIEAEKRKAEAERKRVEAEKKEGGSGEEEDRSGKKEGGSGGGRG